jgi:carbonic anhydrase
MIGYDSAMIGRLAAVIFLQAYLAEAFLPQYGTPTYGTAVYAKKASTTTISIAKDQKDTWKASATVGSEGLCFSGKEQSPINVVTNKLISTTEPVIATHIDTTLSYVRNTGHGFQLFETSTQSSRYDVNTQSKISSLDLNAGSKGYSMISGSKFNFYQVNWHTPSENTVDGKHAIMEAHFVHQLTGL